jgi:CRP/FNR family transcriptional regulator, nitrogen oxide reductase regulator
VTDTNEALHRADLFASLPAKAIDQIAEATHRHVTKRGEFLFHQGDDAHIFYLIQSGRLRLVQHTADGKDVTMATFGPGDIVGLVVALTGDPYPGSAEALEDMETLALSGDVMWQLMNEYAPLAVRALRIVAARLHEAHDRIRELSAERVQQRIARSLLRLARQAGVKEAGDVIRLDLRLSRQDLAQMNGTTLETVSRTLTAWEHEGLIEAGREQIAILKPHALVAIAEDLPH